MSSNILRAALVAVLAGAIAGATYAAPSAAFDEGRKAFESEDWKSAISSLKKEVVENPGHELAYILLAKALEETGEKANAFDYWDRLLSFSQDEAVRREARKGFIRTRDYDPHVWEGRDPFDAKLGVDYRGLEDVDDDNYVVVRTPTGQAKAPPVYKETKHFFIATCNEKLTDTMGEVCEKFLEAMTEQLLDERAWAARVPILCYKDHKDYVSAGGYPAASAGVTSSNPLTGATILIAIYQLTEEDHPEAKRLKNRVKPNLEDTLGHELTHLVLNEFFGSSPAPRWLHEGTARQYEQNRKDFEEAAEIARDCVSGEFIRFRDLFSAAEYPTGGEVLRFYDQGAAMVTFLAEHGPEAFRAFLDELRFQRGHDAAAAAALGIPEEGAVEEFERQWVEWMKIRYAKNLRGAEEPEDCINCEDCDECVACDEDCDDYQCVKCVKDGMKDDEIEELPCKPRCWPHSKISKSDVFRPGINLKKTLESIADTDWVDVAMKSMDDFRDVENSKRHWELKNEKLRCTLPDDSPISALLSVKTYEERPLVMRCKAKYVGDESSAFFGFAQLDLYGDELGVQAVGELEYGKVHELACVLGDEMLLYVDGKCVGRAPAVLPSEREDDIDHPLAVVGSAPVEVWDLDAVTLKDREIAIGAEADDEGEPGEEGDKKGEKKAPKKKKRKRGRGGGSDHGGGGDRL